MSEYPFERDVAWFDKIGFHPCVSRIDPKCRPLRIMPDDGLLLLYWDVERLNMMEDNYVARTGETPPPIVGSGKTRRRA